MNEVVAVDTALLAELDRINDDGRGSQKQDGISFPILKVNYSKIDKNNNKVTKGVFTINHPDGNLYAESVWFRPLLQTFKWQNYDFDNNEMIVETIEVRNIFTEEPIDSKGTLRCGKPTAKLMTEKDKEKFKNVSFSRIVRGLIKAEMKDAKGKTHSIENLPVVMFLKGSNRDGIENEYFRKLPSGEHMRDHWVNMKIEERSNGSVDYYVIHYVADMDERLVMNQPTVETIQVITNQIEEKNKAIRDQYTEALRNNNLDNSAIDALQDALGQELKDAS
tara:strand:- start:1367 stop:2200 length:834 start_codon:yes stop_codon:yes gene_type:complete